MTDWAQRLQVARWAGLLAFAVVATGCGGSDRAVEGAQAAPDMVASEGVRSGVPTRSAPLGLLEVSASDEDWAILERTVRRAWEEGLDSLEAGDRVAAIAQWFVGAPYTPKTLDPDGPERLVVNLREFDCVTLVENVLALAEFAAVAPRDIFDLPDDARTRYSGLLADLRYRGGRMGAYPTRLHYFSEWLTDNDARGNVRLITSELGGVVDDEPIDFMSTHADAYWQLADADFLAEVEATEARLNLSERVFIPQDQVASHAEGIRSGDVIAATSTVPGLDIAHTGIALRVGDVLHLLHAPLVGSVVEISELPLAERLQGISGQDGIMVARPLSGG